MSLPNTIASLSDDLRLLGLERGSTIMVHTSFSQVGWTVGGAVALIQALLNVLGDTGTLVMPAESPQVLDPELLQDPRVDASWHDIIREHLPAFDPDTTPTTMGTVAETFRTYPGTLRSNHPLVSVCANGPLAEEITMEHAEAFCEGTGTPFEKLYTLKAHTLLLGVGFNRCTSLHFAESLVANRRTMVHRYVALRNGVREWVEVANMGHDNGAHFPIVGEQFKLTGRIHQGRVGSAESMLFGTVELVDFARRYFEKNLPAVN